MGKKAGIRRGGAAARGCLGLVAAGLLSAAALAQDAAAAQSTTSQPGAHGAMNMQAQQRLLDGLATGVREVPRGVDPIAWKTIYVPAANEPTAARVALGRKLFYDTRLSHDGSVACATCHDVSRGFSDRRPVSEGIGGHLGERRAPTVMNAALFETMFWDGRAPSLEEQAKLPILNPIEMGQPSAASAVAAIASDSQYRALFRKAYGTEPNYPDVGRAIASFERTLIFLDAPFDRFMAGDGRALSASAQRGFALFNGKARCVSCHMLNPSNPLGTDNRFHNIGVSAHDKNFEALARKGLAAIREGSNVQDLDRLALATDLSELGRFMITRNRADIGAFKTEQLRNVGITGPYMHDGSMQTLWDVMDHYNKGGEVNAYLDGGIEPLDLSEDEVNDVVAFLFSLTDVRFAQQNQAAYREQKARAGRVRPFRDDAVAHRRVLPFETRVMGAAGLK